MASYSSNSNARSTDDAPPLPTTPTIAPCPLCSNLVQLPTIALAKDAIVRCPSCLGELPIEQVLAAAIPVLQFIAVYEVIANDLSTPAHNPLALNSESVDDVIDSIDLTIPNREPNIRLEPSVVDDHAADEHGFDENAVGEHRFDEHGVDEHRFDEHGVGELGLDERASDQGRHDFVAPLVVTDPNDAMANLQALPRMKRPSPSPVAMLVQWVGGGALGIPLALGFLWWVAGRDPLQLGPKVARVVPWIVPQAFRGSSPSNVPQTDRVAQRSDRDYQPQIRSLGPVPSANADQATPTDNSAATKASGRAVADDTAPVSIPAAQSRNEPIEDQPPLDASVATQEPNIPVEDYPERLRRSMNSVRSAWNPILASRDKAPAKGDLQQLFIAYTALGQSLGESPNDLAAIDAEDQLVRLVQNEEVLKQMNVTADRWTSLPKRPNGGLLLRGPLVNDGGIESPNWTITVSNRKLTIPPHVTRFRSLTPGPAVALGKLRDLSNRQWQSAEVDIVVVVPESEPLPPTVPLPPRDNSSNAP
jgi:hypothetical protein